MSDRPRSVRLKRIDDGHLLVPGTEWEIVREADGERWAVYDGNEKIKVFADYKSARAWALED
jgi:hypothetical protein